MWLLEWPGPALHAMDAAMSAMPAGLRVVIWGAASGALSMWLYGVMSPQQRIARLKREQLALRHQLDRFDGEFAKAWLLIRRLLMLSIAQLGRVMAPAVGASVPLLFVLVWMSVAHSSTECLPFGPWWMRGWEVAFFAALIATSLLLKRWLGIH